MGSDVVSAVMNPSRAHLPPSITLSLTHSAGTFLLQWCLSLPSTARCAVEVGWSMVELSSIDRETVVVCDSKVGTLKQCHTPMPIADSVPNVGSRTGGVAVLSKSTR